MTDLTIRTLEASTKTIPRDTVSALRGTLRGAVALPGEDGYEAARSIWNAMVDRRPGLVIRCLGAESEHPAAVGHVAGRSSFGGGAIIQPAAGIDRQRAVTGRFPLRTPAG